jgi:hypothetical protein
MPIYILVRVNIHNGQLNCIPLSQDILSMGIDSSEQMSSIVILYGEETVKKCQSRIRERAKTTSTPTFSFDINIIRSTLYV